MKIFYFVSLVAVMVFFSACSTTPQIMTPEKIDSKAIAPSNENNLFSAPKNGYARLIMYRDYKFAGGGVAYNVFVKYNYKPAPKKQQENNTSVSEDGTMTTAKKTTNEFDNITLDRALCRMGNNSSCIVNIKAGQPLALIYEIDMGGWVVWSVWNAISDGKLDYVGAFTPKNQHIYCINLTGNSNFRQFRDKDTCLNEYKKMYKSKHRDYQNKWFNGLIEKGDKRAYKE